MTERRTRTAPLGQSLEIIGSETDREPLRYTGSLSV
jgi:hypothetical protein